MNDIQNQAVIEEQYDKIGGWLILAAFGVIVAPIRLLILIINDILPAFEGETWSLLTTPGTEVYHSLWAPILIFELVTNIIFIVFLIGLAVLLFGKRKIFPKMMIVFLLANLIFVAFDYFAANLIPVVADQSSLDSMMELIRIFVACLIWIPYMLVSKRVKGTFVR